MKRSQLPAVLALLGALAPAAAHAVAYGTPIPTMSAVGKSVVRVRVQAAPDGAVGGFRVEWMTKADFDAYGTWPPEDYAYGLVYCQFYGQPTLNTAGGTTTFQLGPNAVAEVEVGDIYDETGLYANYDGDMQPGTEYLLRVRADGYGPILPSPWSSPLLVITATQSASDCTYTLGYWKNHPANWPTGSLQLGNVVYTQAQLLQILNTPAQGNGLVFLAHQVIATMLNLLNGATIPVTQANALSAAQALIGNLLVPSVGTDSLAPSQASTLTQTLDEYNNGITGPGHCGVVPAVSRTWSSIKTLLR